MVIRQVAEETLPALVELREKGVVSHVGITDLQPENLKWLVENTPEGRNAYLRKAEYRNTDWFDLLFSNALQHNHAVSISSGTEKSQYYASISAMLDPGWAKQSNVNRYTANFNANFNIFQKLSFNMISSASYRKQRAPGTLSSDVDVVSGEVKRDFDINPYS